MKFSQSLLLLLKGCAMGTADVVPGVSGGTIAFISGIYEELIESIRKIDFSALRLLFHGRFRALWQHINAPFLLPVLMGVGIAIFSLARLMTWLLANHPIEIWSFFFGLIIASALLVARQIERWNMMTVIALVVGTIAAWWITVASTGPNARHMVVYPVGRRHRDLRHDPARYFGGIHPVATR